jgi:ABC-type transport system substrate-binding protein
VPDLATSWSWNEEGTELTMLMDAASENLRVNPRKAAWSNLDAVSTNGDWEVTFHLKRPQPVFPMLLADGFFDRTPHTSSRPPSCSEMADVELDALSPTDASSGQSSAVLKSNPRQAGIF